MRAVALVLVLLLASGTVVAGPAPAAGPPGTNGTATPPRQPGIVAVYPNPTLANDRGEFVIVSIPPESAPTELTLTDGEVEVQLPPNAAGRLAVASSPHASNLTDAPLARVDPSLRLANAGEEVVLLDGERVVDAVTYPRAPEGAIYRRTERGWRWRRPGATAFPVRTASAATVRVFALPDAPGAALEPFRTAERRLWVAGYTLTAERVVDRLCTARGRGVDVRVLVELEPVGGIAASEARRLDRLVDCGVGVRAIGGPHGRYVFHHAKYAVADDRAVVLTENWKPSGVGGRSSRGWGVVVSDPAVAAALAETFRADVGWRDARPWADVRARRSFVRTESPANGTYAPAFTPADIEGVAVEVVVAPDNAEGRIIELLDGATATIRVIQVSVGSPSQPFVRALIRAARRGVSVQLLLADVWYVREHNRAVAEALNTLAREAGIPLRVRLAVPRGRYGKIHAKGAVVDDAHVLVGSLNWNNVSARQNREVALILHSDAVGRYYERVFRADWQGGRWRMPVGLVTVAAGLAGAAGLFARRTIGFDPSAESAGSVASDETDRGWP